MRLVVIIPALNEESAIQAVVRAVPRSLDGVDEWDEHCRRDGAEDDRDGHRREGRESEHHHSAQAQDSEDQP